MVYPHSIPSLCVYPSITIETLSMFAFADTVIKKKIAKRCFLPLREKRRIRTAVCMSLFLPELRFSQWIIICLSGIDQTVTEKYVPLPISVSDNRLYNSQISTTGQTSLSSGLEMNIMNQKLFHLRRSLRPSIHSRHLVLTPSSPAAHPFVSLSVFRPPHF